MAAHAASAEENGLAKFVLSAETTKYSPATRLGKYCIDTAAKSSRARKQSMDDIRISDRVPESSRIAGWVLSSRDDRRVSPKVRFELL
jgi:hypothetical protein